MELRWVKREKRMGSIDTNMQLPFGYKNWDEYFAPEMILQQWLPVRDEHGNYPTSEYSWQDVPTITEESEDGR